MSRGLFFSRWWWAVNARCLAGELQVPTYPGCYSSPRGVAGDCAIADNGFAERVSACEHK